MPPTMAAGRVRKTTSASRQLDNAARWRLTDELEDIARWLPAAGADTSLNIWNWLAALPVETRVLGSGPRPGSLHVAPLLAGGHTGRGNTYLLGLDDSRFPGAGLEDPLLLDQERRELSPELSTGAEALEERTREFARLLAMDTPAAVAELDLPHGMAGAEGEHLAAVLNEPGVHNLVICTLCSCFPWPVLGLPPYWYKDPVFRARAAREPRTVLGELGVPLDPDTEVRVWDSTSERRYLVLAQRPGGVEDWAEDALAKLVTRNSMIGTQRDLSPPAGPV